MSSEGYGVSGTMVIATQTTRTMTVPLRVSILKENIAEGTRVNANAAACAGRCSVQRFVCHEKGLEETPQNVGFETGKTSRSGLKNAFFMKNDRLCYLFNTERGSV